MKYFPLSSANFSHQFGIRALGPGDSIVETTDHYEVETEAKRGAIDLDPNYHFVATDRSIDSQFEVAHLITQASDILTDSQNLRLHEPIVIDASRPLLSISRHVQEDLTILRNDPEAGYPLIAGSVCFPSGWCIGEKIGRSITSVHAPVPEFESLLAESTYNLMRRLKVGRPVWRTNWGIRSSGQLDQSPRHQAMLARETSLVDADNAGERCCFRVERQTLARLPKGGDILFAIHTHQCKLGDLSEQEQRNLLGVLGSCPEATLAYKGILPMRAAIQRYLEISQHH